MSTKNLLNSTSSVNNADNMENQIFTETCFFNGNVVAIKYIPTKELNFTRDDLLEIKNVCFY